MLANHNLTALPCPALPCRRTAHWHTSGWGGKTVRGRETSTRLAGIVVLVVVVARSVTLHHIVECGLQHDGDHAAAFSWALIEQCCRGPARMRRARRAQHPKGSGLRAPCSAAMRVQGELGPKGRRRAAQGSAGQRRAGQRRQDDSVWSGGCTCVLFLFVGAWRVGLASEPLSAAAAAAAAAAPSASSSLYRDAATTATTTTTIPHPQHSG